MNKRYHLYIAVVFLSVNFVYAQSPTAEQWREDLRYLAAELPRLHINLFHSISPEDFNTAVSELYSDIPLLPDHAIIIRMARILAMAKEGHTYLNWSNPTRTLPFGRLPVRFLVFKDGLYVTEAAPFDVVTNRGRVNVARAIGARVVRIGETDIDAAWLAITSIISSDNTEGVRADFPRHAHRPEILHALGLIQNLEQVPIRLQYPNGNLFEINFISLPGSPPPNFGTSAYPSRTPIQLYRTRPTSQFYWYEYLSEAKTVYFQYNQCVEMPGLPFGTFLTDLLNFIDTHEVVKIAIDLRRNSGGNSAILIPFINAIRARPHLNQRGRLFVLIDNGTKSSAIHNAIHFRQLQTNPILVGESTGGKPNGYGEIRSFTLPNSGLNVIYSTRLFQIVPGDPPALHPDVLIEFASADYFAGRDPVLEAVLAY